MKQKKRFFVILPLIVLPFLTLIFWILGGGKSASGTTFNLAAGINASLPDPKLVFDEADSKLAFYDRAVADSMRLQELARNDPYLQNKQTKAKDSGTELIAGARLDSHHDPNEEKVNDKLRELNRLLENPPLPAATQHTRQTKALTQDDSFPNVPLPIAQTQDPELQQLDGMLDKIMDIQHPERINSRSLPSETKTGNLAVTGVSVRDSTDQYFFGLGRAEQLAGNAIDAVVHQKQTLVNGSVIKLRLVNDIYIQGQLVTKEHFVYGTVSLVNERLAITIRSIRDGHSLYPVKLEVYDMDGLPGIYIPGSITRDVSKQATDNAIQSVALNSLDPSIGAQAAGAGIETAKQLLSKKVKLIRVQVKAGYKILLKDIN